MAGVPGQHAWTARSHDTATAEVQSHLDDIAPKFDPLASDRVGVDTLGSLIRVRPQHVENHGAVADGVGQPDLTHKERLTTPGHLGRGGTCYML